MNAILHGFPHPVPPVSADQARDHLGGLPVPGPVTYHATLSARDTGGPLGLSDCSWPEGHHVRDHVHAAEDEIVIVLSGMVEFRLAGRVLRRGPGTSTFIPRGTGHAVRALTAARVLAILTRRSLEVPDA